jgi:hypothetical protein
MRHVRHAVASLLAASLLAACGGGSSTSPLSGIPPSGAVRSKLPKFLRIGQTPARPPLRRHAITSAMRARALAGGWQPLTNTVPWTNGAGSQLLMTDGTVLVQDYCTPNWWSLKPDKTGSYQNGTWTQVASMSSSYAPLYFASAVLPDGKVMVNGGEYNSCRGDETPLGAMYDPVANTWTPVPAPSGWSEIGDAQSVVLNSGTYMIGNCCGNTQAEYSEGSSSWTVVGTGKSDQNSEEGWTLLRNGKVLTADVFGEPNSELFNPTSSSWSTAGTVPVNLTQADEIGPQTMLPNNMVLVAGADQYTAIYNAKTGQWTQGPNFPTLNGQQLDIADGPSTVLISGKAMLAASPGVYNTPAQLLLYNGKNFVMIANPPDAVNDSSYNIRLLLLPNGQILEDDGSNDVEVYSAKTRVARHTTPAITSVSTSLTPGSTYPISGTRFNGDTQANFYGDDSQQATNYPLVRITNNGTGDVFYARTHGTSFMGIGSRKKVSTSFDVPSGIETGASNLVVVANGVASPPVSVTIGTRR